MAPESVAVGVALSALALSCSCGTTFERHFAFGANLVNEPRVRAAKLRGHQTRKPLHKVQRRHHVMLENLGEPEAAATLMATIEAVTANPALHTKDLGGNAMTHHVTLAVCEAIGANKPIALRSD